MEFSPWYVGAVAAVGVAVAAALLTGGGGEAGTPDAGETVNGSYKTTADGTRYTVHPDELVLGCSGKDCIPAIDDPSFTSAGAAGDWLADDDLVIGVEHDGEARAYPFRILNVHEIVNDEIGGRPVAVTYCPLCRSGLTYSRQVDGRTLTFGVSGRLHNANLVMYDRQTETYWSQIQGEAIVGPLVPGTLELMPSTTEWSQWRDAHPETRVLSRDTGIYPASTYDRDPYSGYATRDQVGFGVDAVDDRLHSKTLVHGVVAGGRAVAYPEDTIEAQDVINDRVGGVPVAVVEDQRDGGIRAFRRQVNGSTVRFSAAEDGLVDGSGERWTFDGAARSGPHAGASLERLPTHGFYWFAWSTFHPDTDVYNATEE